MSARKIGERNYSTFDNTSAYTIQGGDVLELDVCLDAGNQQLKGGLLAMLSTSGDVCDNDTDGDGTPDDDDCAPLDPLVFPGAAEVGNEALISFIARQA